MEAEEGTELGFPTFSHFYIRCGYWSFVFYETFIPTKAGKVFSEKNSWIGLFGGVNLVSGFQTHTAEDHQLE